MGRSALFMIVLAVAVAIGWLKAPSDAVPATGATVSGAPGQSEVVSDPFFEAARPTVVASGSAEAGAFRPSPTRYARPGASDPTVLKRHPDGHFYVDALVEGRSIHFMIDTGATGIALTGDDARALGRSWSDGELQVVGRGVSGEVTGKPVQLGSVRVGEKEANNVRAVVIPAGLDVSLLGQSFLSRYGITISGDEMRLS